MAFDDDAGLLYSERLTPSVLAWLLAPGFGLVFFLMFYPIDTLVSVIIGIVAGLLAAVWLWSLSSVIQVRTGSLRAGPARIELSNLGAARILTPEQMRHELGPGSDARSFVITRPWVRGGVMVEVVDERDPTPSWVLSTRNPQGLLSALEHARTSN